MDLIKLVINASVLIFVIGLAMIVLEFLFKDVKEKKLVTNETRINLMFYAISVPSMHLMKYLSTAGALFFWAFVLGKNFTLNDLMQGHGWAREIGLGANILLIALSHDLLTYWLHRLMHSTRLFFLHAVHHAPHDVDWSTLFRIHPIENMIAYPIRLIPMILMGIPFSALLVFELIHGLYGVFVHSNVNIRLPRFLRYIISDPAYHRWHHTSESEAAHKNYAGLFSFYDLIFGTFYYPDDKSPQSFGLKMRMPDQFVPLMLWPIKRLFRM